MVLWVNNNKTSTNSNWSQLQTLSQIRAKTALRVKLRNVNTLLQYNTCWLHVNSRLLILILVHQPFLVYQVLTSKAIMFAINCIVWRQLGLKGTFLRRLPTSSPHINLISLILHIKWPLSQKVGQLYVRMYWWCLYENVNIALLKSITNHLHSTRSTRALEALEEQWSLQHLNGEVRLLDLQMSNPTQLRRFIEPWLFIDVTVT